MALSQDNQPASVPQASGRSSSALTSFVGRDADVERVVALITDPQVRLLTLTGPGGVGKTRIAEELVSVLETHFPDGVRFIELAAIADPLLLPAHLLRDIGGERDASEPEIDAICNRVGDRRMLLILDNMEQLVSSAPLIQEILIRCPNATALVTSRVLLRVRGEFEYLLEPLPYSQSSVESEAPAVRLLMDRARAIGTGGSARHLTQDLASEICQRVDGLPLAIELAAAQMRLLTPVELLSRLSGQAQVGGRGPSDTPDRHQTMQSAVQWSVDLLGEGVRAAFLMLSVCTGGFDLTTAQELTGIEDERDFLDTIDELVSHNLIRRTIGSDGQMRFSLLETIKSFAREQLVREKLMESTRERHAVLFIARAELGGPLLRTETDQQEMVWDRLQADIDNFRSAIEWLSEAEDWRRVAQIVTGLDWFWTDGHYVAEGYRYLSPIADLAAVQSDTALHARSLRLLATLTDHVGNHDLMPDLVERAIAAVKLTGDTRDLAELLHLSSGMSIEQDKLSAARSQARETIKFATEHQEWWFVGAGELNLAIIETLSGDYPAAMAAAERGSEAYRRCGDRDLVHSALNMKAFALLFAGDYVQAQEVYQSVLTQQLARLEDAYYFQHVSRGMASLAARTGQWELAARVSGMAVAEHERTGIALRQPVLTACEAMLAEPKRVLGADAFARLFEEGRALSKVESIQELIALHAPPVPVDRKSRPAPFNLLSNREFEVLQYLVLGKTDPEIAAELFLSPRTVSQHVSSILGKLNVNSRTAAASLASAAKIR